MSETLTFGPDVYPSSAQTEADRRWERDYVRQWLRQGIAQGNRAYQLSSDAAGSLAYRLAETGTVDYGWLYAYRVALRLAHLQWAADKRAAQATVQATS